MFLVYDVYGYCFVCFVVVQDVQQVWCVVGFVVIDVEYDVVGGEFEEFVVVWW